MVLDCQQLAEVPSVVDAGCGTGLLVRALADQGIRAHGFDLDQDLLRVAQTRAGNGASFSLDHFLARAAAVLCSGGPGPKRPYRRAELEAALAGLTAAPLVTAFLWSSEPNWAKLAECPPLKRANN